MSTSLVVVESPAKAKTVSRYLGSGYTVLASYGHVRDLLPKTGAVDTENNFAMQYQAVAKNAKAVNEIVKVLKKSDVLYLATDPDREGEAIAWHLYELLKEKGIMNGKDVRRIVFHEVTKNAIRDAVAKPRALSMDLVNAQQARRALDYLVGFNLSPLLWKKIQRGLSAGRVQSPALRMIAEREDEIEQFNVQEYWTLAAYLQKEKSKFVARLVQWNGKKLQQFTITTEDVAGEVQKTLLQAANGTLNVRKVEKKQRKRHPAAPFITSTLQQEAVRKLGLTTQRTMRVAQQLYEGIYLGNDEGSIGLITYMRTDSVAISKQARDEIRTFIAEHYGKDSLPQVPNVFKTKSKNAQEAHEAIRPTSMQYSPNDIKHRLDNYQFRLYQLIWKRAVASQMKQATIDTVAVDMECGKDNVFRANGSVIADPGFMAVYDEDKNETKVDNDEKLLPELMVGDIVMLNDITPEQHFTEPPPRYTEASLVKTLEKYDIGRPSTYASIIQTLQQREYVELDKKRFTPTDIGRVVNTFLTKHFENYVNYGFTARLEDELDEVSRGEKDWVPLMQVFWQSFAKQIKGKDETISRGEAMQARELGVDPQTGLPVSVRVGRFGPYVQIGTKDDEEKPKFASLREGQKSSSITLEDALVLFTLPRELGHTEEGEEVLASVGRFGPYIRYGDKFVSLKDDDPHTVSLEKALALIAEKKIEDANRQINVFASAGISVLKGQYGPYVTDGNKNVKVPKSVDPAALTLDECKTMIANAPERGKRGKRKKKSASIKKAGTIKKATTKKKAGTKKKATTKTVKQQKSSKKKASLKATVTR